MSDPLEVADARDLLSQLLDGTLDVALALHCIRDNAVIETRSNRYRLAGCGTHIGTMSDLMRVLPEEPQACCKI